MKTHSLQHQAGPRRSLPLQQQQKGAKPKAPQAIAPPVTQSAVEINQAKRDSTRQGAAKKGYAATVLAGESTGYAANPDAKKTVLGG
jgi:hypothetical protein